MNVEDYLGEDEDVVCEVDVYEGEEAVFESNRGTLVTTPRRIVYVSGDDVTDVLIEDVTAIEYVGPSYPKFYLNWGVGFLLAGAVLWAARNVELIVGLEYLGVTALLVGVALLGSGHFLRRATVQLHTPNKTYEFSTSDDALADVGPAIRNCGRPDRDG